jgi:hypothetical protein
VDEMNRSFVQFNESAMNSGVLNLRPELARELKATMETFVKIARAAAADGGNYDEDTGELDFDPAAELHKATEVARAARAGSSTTRSAAPPVPEHTDIGWGYAARPVDSSSPEPDHSNALSARTFFPPIINSPYTLEKESALLVSRTGNYSVPLNNGTPHNQSFSLIDTLMHNVSPGSIQPHTFLARVPTPPNPFPIVAEKASMPMRVTSPDGPNLTKTLSLRAPYTYSFQETTFARRLTRATVERGFHLLSTASLHPAAVNHVFKLTLPYMTRDQMLVRFRAILTKSNLDALDCWQTPFIHLGGAGTHYPRRDENGNVIPQPNSWNVRSIGPLKKLILESSVDSSVNQVVDVDLRGFEGEWFDANDVEGYLEEMGVRIDPQSSFAEAYIDIEEGLHSESGPVVYGTDITLNMDPSTELFRPFDAESQTHSSSSGESAPDHSPPRTPGLSTLDQLVAQTDAPYGLDMGVGDFNRFGRMARLDTSGMYEPLGLDLGSGFNTDNSYASLGLDMMGAEPVKRKVKKAVIVDVAKLIEGKLCFRSSC